MHLKPALFCCLLTFVLVSGASSLFATNYYADPVLGSMSNNGSFLAPWGSLSSIFAANKTFAAGDSIFLRSGEHGYTVIRGLNTGYVVILPQPGETPVISRLRVSSTATISASYWKLYQLLIQSEAGINGAAPYQLLEIYPFATYITVSNCTIQSAANTSNWSRQDWRTRCNSGLQTRARLDTHYLIENNLIRNVSFGMTISSSHTVVRNNKVQQFTGDGSRVLGSHILFERNTVQDLMKVMTNIENHDDLFQAFVGPGPGQDTLRNDTIRFNRFICVTDTTRSFRGPAQGMGCFDGVFLNWIIENNVVMPDHWHGISLYGAINCRVINNTVLDPYPYTPKDSIDQNATNIGPAWITINRKTNGPDSYGNIVQNNLVANNVIFATPGMGVGITNKVVGGLANYPNFFVDVSDFSRPDLFDLHLKPGCSAIDAGTTDGAPPLDFDGVFRPQGAGTDLGAFEYVASTSTVNTNAERIWVTVSPNPVQDQLYIRSFQVEPGNKFFLLNSCGQLIWETELKHDMEQLSMATCTPGAYAWMYWQAGLKMQGWVIKL